MRIDAHHHLWRYDAESYGWIESGSVIARSFEVGDLEHAMALVGVDASIVVQARQSDEETRWLLALAARHPKIIGVVGWVDLCAADIEARLDRHAHPRLVGYRHVVQDEADDEFLLAAPFVQGVRTVLRRALSYDILVNHRQLRSVPAFLDRAGHGRFVLDHAAKPAIIDGAWQPWADELAEVARYPNVWCKISGLVTEADHTNWQPSDIERYLHHVMTLFGPERLIWGSDWPVCLLAAPYRAVHDLIADYVLRHCPESHAAIFGGNAVKAYALEPLRP